MALGWKICRFCRAERGFPRARRGPVHRLGLLPVHQRCQHRGRHAAQSAARQSQRFMPGSSSSCRSFYSPHSCPASFVLCITAEVVLLKWLLVGRVRAGTYPVHGGFYVRNWIVDQLLILSLDHVGQLHATLYLAPWYRALGAKLGRFVELSTASSSTPDLLEIGDESTIADEVSLGAARVEGGWMTVAPTRLGRRVFIGNTAVVPAGTSLGDESLVGVLSIAPSEPAEAARTGASGLRPPPDPACPPRAGA